MKTWKINSISKIYTTFGLMIIKHVTDTVMFQINQYQAFLMNLNVHFCFAYKGFLKKKKKKRGLTSPLSVVIVAQNEWLPFVGSFELVIIYQWGRLYLISNVGKKFKNAEWKSHLRIRLDMLQNLSLISTDCDFFFLYF